MLQLTCAALVLITALGKLTVLRQWLQQRDLAGAQQVATVAGFQPFFPGRN